eukprot:176378_1
MNKTEVHLPIERQVAAGKISISEWKINEGDPVKQGEVLARLKISSHGSISHAELFSPCADGKLLEICVPEEDDLDKGETLCVVEWCAHDLRVNGLCANCGADLTQLLHSSSTTDTQRFDLVVGRDMTLELSEDLLNQQTLENSQELLDSKKLLLILDIDHTVLHATKDSRFDPLLSNTEFANETHRFQLNELKSPYYVKLRPHMREFLKSVTDIFDVRVYTMGLRHYAEEVLSIIDPDHQKIGKRVVCRDDHRDKAMLTKELHRLFPVDERMVLVVDDRTDVWKGIKKNVVQVPKFHFFEGMDTIQTGRSAVSKDILRNLSRQPLNLGDLHTRNKDNVLQTILHVLKAVHDLFYLDSAKENPPNSSTSEDSENRSLSLKQHQDTRDVLARIKKSVLKDVTIAFSGVFPVNVSPEKATEWKLAKKFGAKCVKSFSRGNPEKVTHLIGYRGKTEKVSLARKTPGVHVVNVFWLHHSTNHFSKAPESQFPLDSKHPTSVRPSPTADKRPGNRKAKGNGAKKVRFSFPGDPRIRPDNTGDQAKSVTSPKSSSSDPGISDSASVSSSSGAPSQSKSTETTTEKSEKSNQNVATESSSNPAPDLTKSADSLPKSQLSEDSSTSTSPAVLVDDIMEFLGEDISGQTGESNTSHSTQSSEVKASLSNLLQRAEQVSLTKPNYPSVSDVQSSKRQKLDSTQNATAIHPKPPVTSILVKKSVPNSAIPSHSSSHSPSEPLRCWNENVTESGDIVARVISLPPEASKHRRKHRKAKNKPQPSNSSGSNLSSGPNASTSSSSGRLPPTVGDVKAKMEISGDELEDELMNEIFASGPSSEEPSPTGSPSQIDDSRWISEALNADLDHMEQDEQDAVMDDDIGEGEGSGDWY